MAEVEHGRGRWKHLTTLGVPPPAPTPVIPTEHHWCKRDSCLLLIRSHAEGPAKYWKIGILCQQRRSLYHFGPATPLFLRSCCSCNR